MSSIVITRHSVKSPGVRRLGISLTKADIAVLDRVRAKFDAEAPVSRSLAISSAIHVLAELIDRDVVKPEPIGFVQVRHGQNGRQPRATGVDLRIDFEALAGVIKRQQEAVSDAA